MNTSVIKACLKSSLLWDKVQPLKLHTNMRAYLSVNNENKGFPQYLLNLRKGKIYSATFGSRRDEIDIDDRLGHIVHTMEHLIHAICPNIENTLQRDHIWLTSRVILSPRNDTVNEINDFIMQKVPGQIKHYKSIDTVSNIENTVHYPQEFFNSLNPSGLPPHKLMLKIGIPIMLLRNLYPPNMCNGTRLLIKDLRDNVIVAVIHTGPATGILAHIPRIPMIPTDYLYISNVCSSQ